MKKIVLAIVAAALMATPAMAAMPMTVGGELGLGIAFDDGLDDADFGDRVGFPIINLRAMFLLENVQVGANPLAVGALVGYNRYYTFEYPGVEMSFSAIPILGVAQIRPIAQPLYVEAGLGFQMAMAHIEYNTAYPLPDVDDSSLEFGLMLGAGYAVALNEQMEIPVGARMMMIFSDGSAKQLQLTAGFNYKL